MKAITVYQPWASLLACGAKGYETKARRTNYRGQIAIHAGMKNPMAAMTAADLGACLAMAAALGAAGDSSVAMLGHLVGLPRGAVIATAVLVECWEIRRGAAGSGDGLAIAAAPGGEGRAIGGTELLLGDWSIGRYAWELANVQMLPEPVPAKGQQGLWEWRIE